MKLSLRVLISSALLLLGSMATLVAGDIADCCPEKKCCPPKQECPKCCPKPKPCCPTSDNSSGSNYNNKSK